MPWKRMLACITGSVNADLLHTELTPEQREFVEVVRMSGESLLTIINDILDFSKIEAGKLKFELLDFELRTAVEEVTMILSEQTRAKELQLCTTVDTDVPETVRGDPGRLRQVLTNLVSNAIKFTPKGDIHVRVTQESESDAHVVLRFEVTDTGIGVPEEARACLFQPFSQVDASTTRKYGGTGLGLAICKQLVNLMGGRIGCDSASGKGSTFWFTVQFEKTGNVPCFANASAEVDPKTPLPARPWTRENVRRRIRVLIAEDNAFNQKVVLRSGAGNGVWGRRGGQRDRGAAGTSYDSLRPGVDGLPDGGDGWLRVCRGNSTAGSVRVMCGCQYSWSSLLLSSDKKAKTSEGLERLPQPDLGQ